MYEMMIGAAIVLATVIAFTVIYFFFIHWQEKQIEEEARHSQSLKDDVVHEEEILETIEDKNLQKKMVDAIEKAKKSVSESAVKNGRDVSQRELLLQILKESDENEDVALRKEIIKKLANLPEYVEKDDGSKVMVVPLEALGFLNRYLNPLVNEQGEIVVKMKEDPIIEDIKRIIISLKNDDEIIYKSDEELLQAVKEVILIAKKMKLPVSEAVKKFKEGGKNVEDGHLADKNEKKSERENGKSGSEKDSFKQKSKKESIDKKEAIDSKENADKKEVIESSQEKKSTEEFDMDDIGDDILPSMEDLADIKMPEEFEEISLQDAIAKNVKNDKKDEEGEGKKSADSVYEMLASKKWKEGKNLPAFSVNRMEIAKTVEQAITNNMREFVSNIVKQAPIVFNDSKTEAFVDQKIIIVALAKLYGPDAAGILAKLKKLPVSVSGEMKKGFAAALKPYMTKEKMQYWTFKKDGFCVKGFGAWLDKDFFKIGFDEDGEFDFYRSFVPDDGFASSAKNDDSCKSQLVKDYSNTEIKRERA